jgi:hypothetical protein
LSDIVPTSQSDKPVEEPKTPIDAGKKKLKKTKSDLSDISPTKVQSPAPESKTPVDSDKKKAETDKGLYSL